MTENIKLFLYEQLLADIMQHPDELDAIIDGLKHGYPELAQELLDKPI